MSAVVGMKELQAEIARFSRELDKVENPMAMAAGSPIREKWAALVPVADGNYRASIAVVWLPEKHTAAIGTSMVSGLPRDEQPFIYAPRLEYGDDEISAQPAARPALKQARAEALEASAEPVRALMRGRRPKRKV